MGKAANLILQDLIYLTTAARREHADLNITLLDSNQNEVVGGTGYFTNDCQRCDLNSRISDFDEQRVKWIRVNISEPQVLAIKKLQKMGDAPHYRFEV